MRYLDRLPAVPMLVALWSGVAAGAAASALPVPGICALAALSLALDGRARCWLFALACGLLLGVFEGERRQALQVAAARPVPVEVTGRLVGPWQPRGDGRGCWLEIESLRRGDRLWSGSGRLALTVYGAGDLPLAGSRVRALAHLRQPATFLNGRSPRRPQPRLVIKAAALLQELAPPALWEVAAAGGRQRFEALFDRYPGSPGVALARALLLGEAYALPLPWRQALTRLGLAHLMAVSGLHLGIVAGLAAAICLPLPRSLRSLLVVALCLAFGAVVGPRPSLMRALGMVLMACGARWLRRPAVSGNALAWVAVALIVDRPSLIEQVGFQLTVLATAGMVILAPVLASQGASALRRALAASVAAQVATWPVTLPTFGLIHPAAPLLNLIAVPWTAITLATSLLWSLIGGPGGTALLDVLAWPFALPSGIGPQPWQGLPVAIPAIWAVVLAAVACWVWRRPRRLLWLLPLLLQGGPGAAFDGPVSVTLLDVGQGDAVLLQDGPRAVLVDAPGWPDGDFGGRVLVPALARLGVHRLEAVVLSHPDLDHCGGLADLLAYLPVREVWVGEEWSGDPCADRLRSLAGGRWRLIAPGRPPPAVGRWRLAALVGGRGAAVDPAAAASGRQRNDRSLVMVALAEGRCLLLTGDIGRRAEARLLKGDDDLACDRLKVAHHGSRSSSGQPWLARTGPRWALVSAGVGNSYGHPSPATLERFRQRRIATLSTHRDGRITLFWRADGAVQVAVPFSPRGD
ncbi:MAG: ComEC/Rec2 family competence protein [Acidobacteriota bacterium]